MKIGSICRRRIVTLDAAGTVAEAAALMAEQHVGALVITTATPDGPRVAGMVTDRDLVIDVLAHGPVPATMTIGQIANRPLAGVDEEADLGDAAAVMQKAGVRRLLVTDREQRLVGIVSFDDLLLAAAGDLSALAGVSKAAIDRETAEHARAVPPAPPLLRVPAMGTAGWQLGR